MKKATVIIDLASEGELELVPSLAAMTYLNSKYDNMQAVLGKLSALDYRVYADVIIAGLKHQLKNGNQIKNEELQEAVYETGIVVLMPKLIEFIAVLLNGGKKVEEDSGDKEKDPDPEAE